MTPEPRPARPDELRWAFELLFARLSQAEREYRVGKALELAVSGELDVGGVLVVPGGVFVCQAVAGAGGLVWPPVAENAWDEDSLIQSGCEWLRGRGARVAQCLLAEDEAGLGASLVRNGFRHVTGLTYLRHDLRSVPAGPSLEFECYDEAHSKEFRDLLERSYEATLDCPEVNGTRTIDEVIRGHQSQGRYDPSRWWMVRDGGVLLVVEPTPSEWEVAYVGVVPAARRRGVGRRLLLQAMSEARAAGAARVVLCVDDRNAPARALYREVGFEEYDHRHVLLAVW